MCTPTVSFQTANGNETVTLWSLGQLSPSWSIPPILRSPVHDSVLKYHEYLPSCEVDPWRGTEGKTFKECNVSRGDGGFMWVGAEPLKLSFEEDESAVVITALAR